MSDGALAMSDRNSLTVGPDGPALLHDVRRDNQDECRIASFRNAPERAGHCLTRMLPMRGHFVNQKSNDFDAQWLGDE
jgi:hypothetical protein